MNSLLTILNERRFDNGKSRQTIPLLAVVAASNELPESEELDALYDRRVPVRDRTDSCDDNNRLHVFLRTFVTSSTMISKIWLLHPFPDFYFDDWSVQFLTHQSKTS